MTLGGGLASSNGSNFTDVVKYYARAIHPREHATILKIIVDVSCLFTIWRILTGRQK